MKKGTPTDCTLFEVDPEVFLEIGSGIIDLREILFAAREKRIEYAILNQDNSTMDKIESIKKSVSFLIGMDI